jgi:hypothetical protein
VSRCSGYSSLTIGSAPGTSSSLVATLSSAMVRDAVYTSSITDRPLHRRRCDLLAPVRRGTTFVS